MSDDTKSVQQLDLTTADKHVQSAEWIRDNVILKNHESEVLQFNVALPDSGHVSLFMNTSNQYLLGFQGKDKVYLLRDKDRDAFKNALIEGNLVAVSKIEYLDIGSDHSSLGTLQLKK